MNFNSSSSINSIHIITLILIIKNFLVLARTNLREFEKCDYHQELRPASQHTIGYVGGYSRGISCRWAAEAPAGYKITLDCNNVQMPPSFACLGDQIQVSTAGRADMSDAKRFCGPFRAESLGTQMTVSLKSTPTSSGGKFRCLFSTVKSKCTCGSRNRGKIGNNHRDFNGCQHACG
jgi:hypothetical protein